MIPVLIILIFDFVLTLSTNNVPKYIFGAVVLCYALLVLKMTKTLVLSFCIVMVFLIANALLFDISAQDWIRYAPVYLMLILFFYWYRVDNRWRMQHLSLPATDRKVTFILVFCASTYLITIANNDSYDLIVSTNAQSRNSFGWTPLLCMAYLYHRVITVGIKRKIPVVSLLLFCGILIICNTSRAELFCMLLIPALFQGQKFSIKRLLIPSLAVFGLFATESEMRSRILEQGLLKEVSTIQTSSIDNAYENYRSFENSRLLLAIGENFEELRVFGCGIGCSADLGFTMVLAGQSHRYVNVHHNGLLTVLLQTGLVFIMFIAFILDALIMSFKTARQNPTEIVPFMAFYSVVILLFSSVTVGGFADIGVLSEFFMFLLFISRSLHCDAFNNHR